MASWSFECPVEFHLSSSRAVGPSFPTPRTKSRPRVPSSNTYGKVIPAAQQLASPMSSPPASPVFPPPLTSDMGESSRSPRPREIHPLQMSSLSLASPEQALRHSRSHGRLTQHWRTPTSSPGAERNLPNRWLQGRVHIALHGSGGCDGGELTIYRQGVRRPLFVYPIAPLDDDNGWAISDIQHLHASVAARAHAVALRVVAPRSSPPPPPEEAQSPSTQAAPMRIAIPRELSESSATTATTDVSSNLATSPPMTFLNSPSSMFNSGGGKKRNPNESRFSFGSFLPNRSRSKTVSSPKQSPDLSGSEWTSSSSASHHGHGHQYTSPSLHGPQDDSDIETIAYLSFMSAHDRDEWFGILRALAKVPLEEGREARTHRRLKVSVLDLNEIHPAHNSSTTLHPAARRLDADDLEDMASGGSISSEGHYSRANSSKYTPRITRTDDDSHTKRGSVKSGWSWRETIRAELIIDGTLFARTGWVKAAAHGSTPFWGETFSFMELPPFNTCYIHLLKHRGENKLPVVFAVVDLSLVSSFRTPDDERYPIRAIGGGLIGELRLTVQYQEVDVINQTEYDQLVSHSYEGSKFLYVMSGRGVMEGTIEYLVRIGLCEGVLMSRTIDTCTHEATSAGSTLFRSTTPISKTLEVIMRLMCGEFLQAAIGPTIRRVLREKVEPNLFFTYADALDPPVNYRAVNQMREIVSECWHNMYNSRHLFPDFVRHILKHLFSKVKEHHTDEGNDLLRYKAVSSFVFLRLIGPALMSPHLFNLTDSEGPGKLRSSPSGLLSGPTQRTLTLIAKVLHTLAFFSDKELLRHPDIVLFRNFIVDNTDAMMDFIISLASPVKPHSNTPLTLTPVDRFLAERKLRVPEFQAQAVPYMTEAGPIDLSADWAICLETWYEKRQHPGVKLHVAKTSTTDIQHLIARYDGHLDRIHGLAYPAESGSLSTNTCTESAAPLTPSASRPSLNYSVSTKSSEESHSVASQQPRRFGFPATREYKSTSPHDILVSPNESYSESVPEVPETDESTTESPDMNGNCPETPAESPDMSLISTPPSGTLKLPRPGVDRRHSTPTPTTTAGIVESVIDPDRMNIPLMNYTMNNASASALDSPYSQGGQQGQDLSPNYQRSIRRKRRPTLPNLLLNRQPTDPQAPPVPPLPWAEVRRE